MVLEDGDTWLEELSEEVEEIDDHYIAKRSSTSLVQRIAWFKKKNLNVIFQKLPNLMLSDGYRLVNVLYISHN